MTPASFVSIPREELERIAGRLAAAREYFGGFDAPDEPEPLRIHVLQLGFAAAQLREFLAAPTTQPSPTEGRDEIIRETLWMARRYADGRATYAVAQVNEALDRADALGIPIEPDRTLLDPAGRRATDGHHVRDRVQVARNSTPGDSTISGDERCGCADSDAAAAGRKYSDEIPGTESSAYGPGVELL